MDALLSVGVGVAVVVGGVVEVEVGVAGVVGVGGGGEAGADVVVVVGVGVGVGVGAVVGGEVGGVGEVGVVVAVVGRVVVVVAVGVVGRVVVELGGGVAVCGGLNVLPHNVLMCLMSHKNSSVRDIARACDELGGEMRFNVLTLDAMSETGDSIMVFEEGKCYFIETLTKYWVGRIKSASATEIFLTDASWVADTGLMTDFMRTGQSQQLSVEPVGDWQLPVAIITGAALWRHKLWQEPVR